MMHLALGAAERANTGMQALGCHTQKRMVTISPMTLTQLKTQTGLSEASWSNTQNTPRMTSTL